MTKVSVVIPVYNQEKYIRDAIDSVLNQAYRDFEIIVINDGSTDKTEGILEEYGDRIRWRAQENKGPAVARNLAISMAKGEYTTFLDDDDMFLPDRLRLQVDYLDKHPAVGLVYSDYYQVDKKGEIIRLVLRSREDAPLVQQNFIPMSGVMCRRKCIDTLGAFDKDIGGDCDWDMWLRISEKYPIHCIPKPLFKYRVHGKNMSLARSNRLDYNAKVKILLFEKAYERRGKPSWLKFKILRAKIERAIGRIWSLSDERLSGFWWRLDKAIDRMERWMFRSAYAEGRDENENDEMGFLCEKEGVNKILFKAVEFVNTFARMVSPSFYARPTIKFVRYRNRKDKNLIGVEIGVDEGMHALSILKALPMEKLYLIDPYEDYLLDGVSCNSRFRRAQKRLAKFKNIEFIIDKSEDAVDGVPDDLDFVYVDGNHEYEFVKRDIELYHPKVKVGGILGGHDFDMYTVCKAVLEFIEKKQLHLHGTGTDWWIVKK